MVDGEAPDDETTEGVADENVGWRDAGALQEGSEFTDDVGGSAFVRGGATPAEAGAFVGYGVGEGTYCILQVGPIEAGGGDAGLEDDGWAASASSREVHAAAFPDVDEGVWFEEALAVFACACPLIERACCGKSNGYEAELEQAVDWVLPLG
jgi:hypothetical protein